MKRTKRLAAAGVASAMVVLSACGGSDDESGQGGPGESSAPGVTDDSVVVSTTTALTGVVAGVCGPIQDGAAAWIAKVNDEGGVHGRKIEQQVMDDAYAAPEALANAREMAPQSLAMFGGCGSVQVDVILQAAEQSEIPYVWPYAEPTETALNSDLFRGFQPSQVGQAAAITEYMLDTNGPGSVFIVSTNSPLATPVVKSAEEATESAGGTVSGTALLNQAGGGDVAPTVLKIKDAAPDYLFFSSQPADAARIVQGLAQQDAMPKFVMSVSAMMNAAFIDPTEGALDGIYYAPLLTPPPGDASTDECKAVFEEYGQDDLVVSPLSLAGCAQGQLLEAALEDAGEDLTADSFLEALGSWQDKEISSILTPFSYSETQHIGLSSMLVGHVEGGAIELVPDETVALPEQ